MQREHCGLDAQSHHDERKARLHRGVLIQSGQPRRHVGHVERASCGIEEADADHVERCADRPEDQVVEGSRQRAPVASLAGCDERIGSDRRDFEEHERVEGVARVNDASEASLAKQEACLEQRVLFCTDFRDKAVTGEDGRQRRYGVDQQANQRAHRIDAQRDAQRGVEPAKHVVDNTVPHDLAGDGKRHPRAEHRSDDRDHPTRPPARRQRGRARAQQRHDNREDRRLRRK